MSSEIIIGLAGIVSAILIFLLTILCNARKHKNESRSKRIETVFNRYIESVNKNINSGFDGLLKSGVATLESDQEIRELINEIILHGKKNPLGKNATSDFDSVNLKDFFDYARDKNINFYETQIKDIIAEFKKYNKSRELI